MIAIFEITPSQTYHVVLIEQEPIARRRIKHDLTQAGYRVEIAKSLEKGAKLLQHSPPALILLDWDLLGSDRFLQELQQRPTLINTFITCLGHRTNVTDRVRALNIGADEFLSKPIVAAELLAKVKAGLRIHQLQSDLTLKNQTLKAELEEATHYMRSQLPTPLRHPVTIDFRFIPSQHLGGDCFDYFWLTDNHLVLYLLDVSGHGMGATLMAIGVLNDLRQAPNKINLTNPAQVLEQLNQQIQISAQHSKYLTIWYGVYNLDARELTYASAGHPPALLISKWVSNRTAPPKLLKTPGMPIGLFTDTRYQNSRVTIQSDETLYLFSDGIYEFPDQEGNIWGLDAFQSLVQKSEIQQSETFSLDALLAQLRQHCATRQFMDDLSVLRVGFKAKA